MKESAVFLRKLINYQQESGGIAGSSGYRGLSSPPDGQMQSRKTRVPHPLPASTVPTKAGAYVLRRSKATSSRTLEAIRSVCVHNSAVAAKIGEQEKAKTWALLSKVAIGRIQMLDSNHWNPKASWAVGSNLVDLILKYYEKVRDVQMLATIVCVLRQEQSSPRESPSLLPDEANVRYDGYLRRYAELLYSWDLLSLRADINKRLRYPRVTHEPLDARGAPSADIAFYSECSSCLKSIAGNYCYECAKYVFRCSLCDMAVRGLFTVCSKCNHGGHVTHVNAWFQKQTFCPTGCGCRCTLNVIPAS
jgi:hypothetical protein